MSVAIKSIVTVLALVGGLALAACEEKAGETGSSTTSGSTTGTTGTGTTGTTDQPAAGDTSGTTSN